MICDQYMLHFGNQFIIGAASYTMHSLLHAGVKDRRT